MKTMKRSRIAAGVGGTALALVLGLVGGTVATAAPEEQSHAVTVSHQTVKIGDTVEVAVASTGVDDLYAYSVRLGFDPRLLQYVGDSADTDISGATYEKVSANAVDVTHTKLGSSPGASGDATLVTATFKAVASGAASITVGDLISVTSNAVSTSTPTVGAARLQIEGSPGAPTPPATKVATTTKLSAKPRTLKPGKKLTATVTVSAAGATPAGTLKFTYRGKTVRPKVVLKKGKATVTFRPKVRGRHTLRVMFVPAKGFGSSSDSVRIRVK